MANADAFCGPTLERLRNVGAVVTVSWLRDLWPLVIDYFKRTLKGGVRSMDPARGKGQK
jgi:hypothetical protein